MDRRGAVIIAIAALAALALAHAARAAELLIPGSGNPEYVLGQLAEAFNARQAAHRVSVPPSIGTTGAIRDVESNAASLGRVARALKDEERARGLAFVPIGRDPVAFVAGAAVSVDRITRQQAFDAFSGRIRDWRELGGKPGPIRAVGRESGDASRSAINAVLKPFAAIVYHEDVKIVHMDPQALALFDRYATSLGFMNRSALAGAATRLRPLALDAVEPTARNLESGRYPIWLELGLVHKTSGALPDAARAFLDFLRTAEAQGIMRRLGILPAAGGM